MAVALLILGMTAVTFLTRYLLIALLGHWRMPAWLERWLRFIPTAAFGAIAVQGTLAPQGRVRVEPGNPYLWAGVAAGLVAWRTKNVLLTIAVGLGVLWAAKLLG